jgi:hypothetical protein
MNDESVSDICVASFLSILIICVTLGLRGCIEETEKTKRLQLDIEKIKLEQLKLNNKEK